MSGKACVYDIILNGEVVYVGMTKDPEKREKLHRGSGIIARGEVLVVFKWYKTRREAYTAENARLRELMPRYNSFDWRTRRRTYSEYCIFSKEQAS